MNNKIKLTQQKERHLHTNSSNIFLEKIFREKGKQQNSRKSREQEREGERQGKTMRDRKK